MSPIAGRRQHGKRRLRRLHRKTSLIDLALRPIAPQRFQREALADGAENVAFDDAGRRHGLGDRLADMGELYRAAGEEYRVDVVGRQLGWVRQFLCGPRSVSPAASCG